MAIVTSTVKSSDELFEHEDGWKEVLIRKAQYGDGGNYLDIYFEGIPDSCKARIYKTINKKTKEEFKIRNWFRFSNSGIQSFENGMLIFDDDAQNLLGMPINILIYHNEGGYVTIYREPAPTVIESEHQKFTDKDVQYWKLKAESSLKSYLAYKGQSVASNTPVEDIPVADLSNGSF